MMPVYFVQAGTRGPVKIGRAVNPANRIAILQTGCHKPLHLLRTVSGGADTEAWLHRQFWSQHLRGEWFLYDAAMLSVVAPDEQPRAPATCPGLATPTDVELLAGEAGLTLKEVCSRAGIAQSTFSRWRAGKTAPSIEIYQRIVAALRGHPASQDAAE